MRYTSRIAIVSLSAAAIVASAPAHAHDPVVNAWPGDNATVKEFPGELKIEFSGEIKKDFNTFALSRVSDQEVLFSGEPTVDGRYATLDLPDDLAPEAGQYRVGFQIVSSDGHSTKGMTEFTYAPDGQVAPNGDAQGSDAGDNKPSSSDGSSSLTWLWALGGVVLIAGAALAMVGRTRQREALDAHDQRTREEVPGGEK
ncbi:copper resistance CopC family protein [Corynebacterium aquatimens]|uniref:Methionine-rich copper-binding protein CopC n=1 Tax=Corynebacterium aquatimens TaxID=1190508 RepID=A0A931DUI3_9CORY|nr:copper resistance CopC family protein [Corynebacterium aquatimens]MBG6121734.1 methionine-rich copper-binding protein CopC [Corynebacterium aquatimens]WJY65727.1 hypothetical protein CAQUA_05095 [Corynebacterium aquatimens]